MKRTLLALVLVALVVSACGNDTVETLTQQRTELREQVTALEQRQRQLASERDAFEAEVARLQAENEELRAELERIVEQLELLTLERDTLREQLDTNFDAQLQLVESELAQARASVETLEARREAILARMGREPEELAAMPLLVEEAPVEAVETEEETDVTEPEELTEPEEAEAEDEAEAPEPAAGVATEEDDAELREEEIAAQNLGILAVRISPPDARLTLSGPGLAEPVEFEGDETFEGLEPGEYTLTATAEGYEALEELIVVRAAERLEVDIELAAAENDVDETDVDETEGTEDEGADVQPQTND
jgi:outer membrane murein-binding lipoprotein Lpp